MGESGSRGGGEEREEREGEAEREWGSGRGGVVREGVSEWWRR